MSAEPPATTNEANTVLKGGCYCGEVSYEVIGRPNLSALCHCTNCRRLTGCPLLHTMHYEASRFKWTHESPHDDKLDFYVIPNRSWKRRARCKVCGCQIASYNSKTDNWSVWGGQLEKLEDGSIKNYELVRPTAHIFYGTRMMDIVDNLGKWDGYEGKSQRLDV